MGWGLWRMCHSHSIAKLNHLESRAAQGCCSGMVNFHNYATALKKSLTYFFFFFFWGGGGGEEDQPLS